jgi:uncharacterized protein YkwD
MSWTQEETNKIDSIAAAVQSARDGIDMMRPLLEQLAGKLKPPTPAPALHEQVRQLLNAQRVANGVATPLVFDTRLENEAQQRAERMAQLNMLTHFPDGVDPLTWAEQFDGYPSAGLVWEIIGHNFADAPSVVAGWMSSQGHRADVLDTRTRTLGVGVAQGARPSDGGSGLYWVVDFGDLSPAKSKVVLAPAGRLGRVTAAVRESADHGPWRLSRVETAQVRSFEGE